MPTTITVHGPVGNVAGEDVYNYATGAGGAPSTSRVLAFVAASPPSLDRLRLDVELREIGAALEGSDIVLVPVVAARLEDLHGALVQHAPTYLHFAGHGAQDGIVLEDDQGKPFIVGVTFLADLLVYAPTVEVVVLNACYSAAQAELLAEHVPFVIASDHAIADPFALLWAATFYRSLAAGVSPSGSFGFACAVAHSRYPVEKLPMFYG